METNCKYCGKLFTGRRTSARFCSSKCRQRYHRRRAGVIDVGVECSIATDALKNLMRALPQDIDENMIYLEKLNEQVLVFQLFLEHLSD